MEKMKDKLETAEGLAKSFQGNDELSGFYVGKQKEYADAVTKAQKRLDHITEETEEGEEDEQ